MLAGIETAHWVSPGFTLFATGVFGLLIGSFLNVVIHRLPLMMQARWEVEAAEFVDAGQAAAQPATTQPVTTQPATTQPATAGPTADRAAAARPAFNLVVPRSRCPHCGHQITSLENIPIVSWLVLRGRCSACKAPISARYPAIEALTAVLSVAAVWHFGLTLPGVAAVLFCFALVTLAFIDYDTQLLPDDITLPLLWGGLALNLVGGFVPLRDAVIGAMAGYLLLWSIYWLFKLLTGKEGMGYGDFKLLAAFGAWFGWQAIPAIILLSSVVGAVVGVSMMIFAKHGRETPIPFGPYLAGAGLLALHFGKPLMGLYGIG
ncbi:MAG: A24 family peptidase [Lautropia sp.]